MRVRRLVICGLGTSVLVSLGVLLLIREAPPLDYDTDNRLFWWEKILFATNNTTGESAPVFRTRNGTLLREGQCMNTVQGQTLLADDRGYVCKRTEVDSDGCCPAVPAKRFSCDTCLIARQCCYIYEQCVSCCMKDENKRLLEDQISVDKGERAPPAKDLGPLTDRFKACSALCRTSSRSVINENFYRSDRKHCYSALVS